MTPPLSSPLPPAELVQSHDQLRRVAELLEQQPLISVDTEANSLYAYRDRVCLIQISTRGDGANPTDYIIDPLAIKDMSPLTNVFARADIEKVFHAATYDLMMMKRDFGYTFANIFDTMIAARICGYRTIGLNALLNEVVGVQSDKSHQRDDWGKRPLPKASLVYAQMDTHYLPVLRDHFVERLNALGLWKEAHETFEELAEVNPSLHKTFDAEGYWKLGIPNHLKMREMAALRELFVLREGYASKFDLPPFKIIMDKTLVTLAQTMPLQMHELDAISGITPGQIRRYGREILAAIERGRTAPLPKQPPPEPPADPRMVECYSALREWRKQRAEARGVEADVIISREALWTLAERMPTNTAEMNDIAGLGEWRLGAYGHELLEILERFRQKAPLPTPNE